MRPRFHARFPGALCENTAALGANARLAAWRLEPVRTVDGPRHSLDLTFADGDAIAVVAGITLDVDALALRDRSPFIAPRAALAVADRLGEACESLRPELERLFAETVDPGETLRVTAGAEATMTARRDAAALGAVPYAAVARALGGDVAAGAYLETCFAGPIPHTPAAPAVTFGESGAAFRCYVALSDAALAAGGAAYRCALALAEALGGDDLSVDVAGYDGRPLDAYAFVHAVGVDDPHAAAELIAVARARGIRTLLTPLFDDPSQGGFWGARTHAGALALAQGGDEEMLANVLRLVVDRKLSLEDGLLPNKPWEPRPGYRDAQRRALTLADAVFVACAAEAQRIRALCGERSFTAYVPSPHAVAARDETAEPYVLAVAPVGPMHASAALARAAARSGVPVRFAGSILDGGYAARALSALDARSALTPGDPGAGPRVVVDISWSGTDLVSLAAYALHGVPVIGSNRSDVRDVLGARGVWAVDPADEDALAAALSDAWNGASAHAAALAEHVGARCRIDVLRACLAAAYLVPEPAA